MIRIEAVKLLFKNIQIRNFIFFELRMHAMIHWTDVLILHMEADVKDIVTVAMTPVMYLQAIELLQQVNRYFLFLLDQIND